MTEIAKCNDCFEKLKCKNGSTSSLKRHTERKHPSRCVKRKVENPFISTKLSAKTSEIYTRAICLYYVYIIFMFT